MKVENLIEFALFIGRLSYNCGASEKESRGQKVIVNPGNEGGITAKRAAVREGGSYHIDSYIDCGYGMGYEFNFEEISDYLGEENVLALVEKFFPEKEFKESMGQDGFEYDRNYARDIDLEEFIKEVCKLVTPL